MAVSGAKKASRADYMRARTARLRAAGMCVYCGKSPAVDGRVLCQRCRARSNELRRARYRRHRSAGVCATCGIRPVTPGGYVSCGDCREAHAARIRAKVESGACIDCAGPLDRRAIIHRPDALLVRCSACILKRKQLAAVRALRRRGSAAAEEGTGKHRVAGICPYCEQRARVVGATHCPPCARLLRRMLGSPR